jgi:molybdenum cofactor synthesis domain-containing protein
MFKENKKLQVISVNTSSAKGTVKTAVPSIELNASGVKGDAHASNFGIRQVSLLGKESIERFSKESSKHFKYGDFAENITTEGFELYMAHPLDRIICGDLVLEVTQIGKKCHGDFCAIYREVGNCVMPKEGIFARVINPGTLKPGDTMIFQQKVYFAMIITLSDRASQGIYEDKSGPAIEHKLEQFFQQNYMKYCIKTSVIADNPYQLKELLLLAKQEKVDFIFTTGGTGIGPRDITPEVIKPLLDKEIPGIMDHIRLKYGAEKPNALISRSIAGVMGNTLVFALPGSVKAVNEYVTEIQGSLKHLAFMLHGLDTH